MNKIVDFNGIGYVAATFPVDSTTQTYLKTNHLNASTGNVDINGKNLAVKLGTDGTVGFGAASPTSADAMLGVIIAYEMDGFASVQISGGIDEVPTKEAVTTGIKQIAVNDKGQMVVLADSVAASALTKGGKEIAVVKPSTAENLFASIIL